MSKNLTPFERLLKEKMANYEAAYDEQSWYAIDKKMNVPARSHSPWLVALGATLVVGATIGISTYRFQHSPAKALTGASSSERFAAVSKNNIRGSYHTQQHHLSALDDVAPIVSNKSQSEALSGINHNQHLSVQHNSPHTNLTPHPSEIVPIDVPAASNQLNFESNVREGCAGIEIGFSANNGPSSGSYLWNFGDGKFSNEPNPKHVFTKPGKFDISLSVTSNDGQIRTVVANDLITIYPAPDANFQWRFINEQPENIAVEILNTSNNATHYTWKFEDGTTSQQLNPIRTMDESGKHRIALSVSNEFGCKDEVMKQITVNSDLSLGAPSTFHPEKETFMPSALRNMDARFELTIYDMNDSVLYRTTQYNKGWNGKLSDNTYVKPGQYKWKVILIGSQSEQKYFNGVLNAVFP